jgi:hypothetical protein
LKRLASIDDVREIVAAELSQYNAIPLAREIAELSRIPVPYSGLSARPATGSLRPATVFITGRFRSGSTLLWNLFRQVPSVTAYYEPFNERRWFDPQTRGGRVDPTHVNVSDYWREYDGLDELSELFDENWKFRQLYMPAEAVNTDMQRYIQTLVERARKRAVIQFNEVDFRLPWLRRCFPTARIVHLYRNPREQWRSTLRGTAVRMNGLTLEEFEPHDGYYLCRWARDLRHSFPFIDVHPKTHPYKLFYQVWRLSYAFGVLYAELSVALEQILASPRETISMIMRACEIDDYDLDRMVGILSLSSAEPPDANEMRQYAQLESEVETELRSYSQHIDRHALRGSG